MKYPKQNKKFKCYKKKEKVERKLSELLCNKKQNSSDSSDSSDNMNNSKKNIKNNSEISVSE